MPDTILRHWQMLRLVPRAPRKASTAMIEAALADRGFDIDRRSIQRDLMKLSAVFPLECDNRTKPFGWSWSREAAPFDMPGLDLHTALAFRLADQHLRHLLPSTTRAYLAPHFDRAAAVLDELRGGGLGSWPDVVAIVPQGLPLQAPEVDRDVLEAVHTALLRELRLHVRYRRRGETAVREYDASPLGLVYRSAVAYLVCTLREYDDVKQLVLHRMVGAEVLDRPRHEPPAGFDLPTYIRGGGFDFPLSDATFELRALFDAQAGAALAETPLSADQQLTTAEDGRLLLTATVMDTNQIRAWLRGYGAYVEVLAPEVLRAEMTATARALAERYLPSAD